MSKRAKKPTRDFVGEWAEGIRNMRFEQGCGRAGDPREADEYEGYVAPAPPDREARVEMDVPVCANGLIHTFDRKVDPKPGWSEMVCKIADTANDCGPHQVVRLTGSMRVSR